jgi:hypothetical protein
MNHAEAVEQMAVEQYLLDELSADKRAAFEEHVFDCRECALDLRAGAVFVQEAKSQLPALASSQAVVSKPAKSGAKWISLFSWRPAFAVPAFAALLLVVGYQNLVTFPALRHSGSEPYLAPVVPLHPATRGAAQRTTITVDRARTAALPIDLSPVPGAPPPASYSLSLRDTEGKTIWSGTLTGPALEADGEQRFSFMIPGNALHNGAYSLLITSVSAQGVSTPYDQYNFDIVVTN